MINFAVNPANLSYNSPQMYRYFPGLSDRAKFERVDGHRCLDIVQYEGDNKVSKIEARWLKHDEVHSWLDRGV